MKKLMLGLMMAFAVTAEAETIDGINYEFNFDGTATIKGYDKDNPPTKVDVAEVEDLLRDKYTVTSVGQRAFYGCENLASVLLPNATTIGGMAFQRCGELTSVSLPNATTIDQGAFSSCGKLTSVSLPNATTIGEKAFFQCSKLEKIIVNAPMAMARKNNKDFYNVPAGCKILPEYCVVTPHPAEHSTAKVYTDGAEVTSYPIVVASNATAEVVFTAEWGYRFEDYTTVQTNTVIATDDPTEVDGPGAIRNLVVIEPYPAEHSTAKVCTNGVEVTSNPVVVLSNATVAVVFTADYGYCFEDYALVQTNAVKAVNDPTVVDGPVTIKNTVKVVPNPAQHSTAKVYTNGVEVTSNPVVVLSNAMVSVVFEVEGGYCFADDHSTTRTNTVEATNDPTEVVGPDVVKIPLMSVEVAQQAEWGISLKSGNQEISPKEYEEACAFYGIAPEPCPQVVKEGEIAVTKESIEAAKAETISIANNEIQLGVSVLSNANITAEIAEWGKVKFDENTKVGLNEDGTQLIISIPVAAQQGFMILQSGDAKAVPSNGAKQGFYKLEAR